MHAERYLPVMAFGIGSSPPRALVLRSADTLATALRRSSICLTDGACFCALRQSASSVGATAPVSAMSVREPLDGARRLAGAAAVRGDEERMLRIAEELRGFLERRRIGGGGRRRNHRRLGAERRRKRRGEHFARQRH